MVIQTIVCWENRSYQVRNYFSDNISKVDCTFTIINLIITGIARKSLLKHGSLGGDFFAPTDEVFGIGMHHAVKIFVSGLAQKI